MPQTANAAKRGYALVIQDLRGRFKSEGHHAIILGNDGLGEHQDGRDTLEWVAKQPWCDGRVGMFGISWGGFNSIHMSMRNPPALKASWLR